MVAAVDGRVTRIDEQGLRVSAAAQAEGSVNTHSARPPHSAESTDEYGNE